MARNPTALQINGDALKAIIENHGTVESIAKEVGVSRQSLSSWFSENKIPPRRLVDLTKILRLSSAQVKTLSAKKKMQIFFRTKRNMDVSQKTRDSIEDFARIFFVLDSLASDSGKTDSSFNRVSDTSEPKATASKIEKVLGITKYPRTLEQMVLSLRRLGIPVIFVRFESSWRAENVRAFTAEQYRKPIIFIDVVLSYEDALWHVVHEFCHLAVKEITHSTENEKLVTAIANEILTPSEYVKNLQPKLEELISDGKLFALVRRVEEAATFLGVSFEGFVLALQEASIIGKKSSAYKYLYGTINKKKDAHRLSLEDLVFPKHDSVKYWRESISEPSKAYVLRLGALVREVY